MKTTILIRSFFFLFLIWTSPSINAQQTISVYENIGNGTAKWAGASYGLSQGTGNLDFQIPATATIQRILVVALCTRRSTEKGEFEINGIKFLLNSANLVTRYQPVSINNYDTPAEVFLYDATPFFSIADLNNLTIQTYVNNNTSTVETITRQVNVLVEYSDGINNISYVIDLFVPNPLVQINHDKYPLKLMNKPNYSMPVLLSMNGHFSATGFNDTINSGTRIFASNNYLGILGGKDAQKINAFQSNGNVLTSNDASVNSKPELEIYADDVKCSHGSTTGQLDEEAIFYLRARGISEKAARQLMVSAFVGDVMDKIDNEKVHDYVSGKISELFGWEF